MSAREQAPREREASEIPEIVAPEEMPAVVPDQPARAKDQAPRIERLATSYFQRLWEGTPLKADEGVVKMTLDPLFPVGDLRDDTNAWRAVVALTRTATVFVLDQEDVDLVIESMRADAAEAQAEKDADFHPYDVIDLPPLPYPRMAIEVTTPQGYPAAIYASKPAGQGGNHPLMLVTETVAGETWDVFFPSVEPRGESELWNFRIGSGGKFSVPATALRPDNPDGNDVDPESINEATSPRAAKFWRRLTLDLMSLILAENVPHDDLPVARQYKREMARSMFGKKAAKGSGYVFPKVYWVRLEHGGETNREETGRGLSVRFLVRGHWRQYKEGEVTTSTGKKRTYSGKKAWVRPHIKGPAGAPWKGRPVYRGNATETVSEREAAEHSEES